MENPSAEVRRVVQRSDFQKTAVRQFVHGCAEAGRQAPPGLCDLARRRSRSVLGAQVLGGRASSGIIPWRAYILRSTANNSLVRGMSLRYLSLACQTCALPPPPTADRRPDALCHQHVDSLPA